MDLKVVNRDKVELAKKRNSKYRPLIEAIEDLEPEGKAVEVSYEDQKQLNSMRTAVYQYSYKHDIKVKSRRNDKEKKVYFYRTK